jgi:putative peptidoglycan lipid II flippase
MIFRSIFTNSSGILTSRVLGFVRDMMTASVLGASVFSDIFFIAFKIPNLFRNIFAEGAFSQSFIPSYAASGHKQLFSVLTFTRIFSLIVILSILIVLFQGAVSQIVAFGYSTEIKRLSAPIIAINFFYLDLIFIVTFLGALLQYKKHFATTAFSTALLNIAMITALFFAKHLDKLSIVYALSYGVLAGGALQVFVHLLAAKRYKITRGIIVGLERFKRGDDSAKADAKRFNSSFLPSIAGSSTAQISAFIDTWLATFLTTGAISYLYYANRIFQLPLAVFAIATSMALFPSIAKAISENREEEAFETLKKGFWFLAFMLFGFAIGGIMLSHEVIWLIYERGAFVRHDTIEVSNVLAMYMIGLIPFGFSKLFSLWLYSHHQQLKAAKISAFSLFCNAIFSIILMNIIGASGIALSGSITGLILFSLTIREFGFNKFKTLLFDKKLLWLVLFLLCEVIILYFFKGLKLVNI